MRSAFDLSSDRGVDWLTQASCRDYDPEWWTVASRMDPGQLAANARARAICRRCPVMAACEERAGRLGATGTIIAGREFRKGSKRGYHRNMVISRLCQRCRKPFEAANNRQVFCSQKCRVSVNSARRTAQKRMGAG